jgi:membrane protease subunit (stomatin/prohibitin family)
VRQAPASFPWLNLAVTPRSGASDGLRKKVCERIDDEYGLEVPQLAIVNIARPESVEKAIDTRSQMGVIGDLGRYQQFQMADALTAAASSSAGGAASEGLAAGPTNLASVSRSDATAR